MKRTGLLWRTVTGIGLPVVTLAVLYTFLPADAWLQGPVATARKPIEPVAARPKPQPVIPNFVFPAWLVPPRDVVSAGEFLKTRNLSGARLCEMLTEAGIPVGEWKASAAGAGQFECYSQVMTFPSSEEEEETGASIFAMVRGKADGTIEYIRIKLVVPPTKGGQAAIDSFSAVVSLIAGQTHWFDAAPILEAARTGSRVSEDHFGSKITFAPERTSADSFNFILSVAPEAERGTRFLRASMP